MGQREKGVRSPGTFKEVGHQTKFFSAPRDILSLVLFNAVLARLQEEGGKTNSDKVKTQAN